MPKCREYIDEEIALLRSIGNWDTTWVQKAMFFNSRLIPGRPSRSDSALRRKWNRMEKKMIREEAKKHDYSGEKKSNEPAPDDEKTYFQTKAGPIDSNSWSASTNWQSQQNPLHANQETASYPTASSIGLGITGIPALHSGYDGMNPLANSESAQYFQCGWAEGYGWSELGEMDVSLLMASTSLA